MVGLGKPLAIQLYLYIHGGALEHNMSPVLPFLSEQKQLITTQGGSKELKQNFSGEERLKIYII